MNSNQVFSVDIEEAGSYITKEYEWAGAGNPGEGDEPKKNPEIEPEKLPHEDPGIQPDTKPKKEDDDDDDDDDDNYTPYTEPEIGDDPDKEKIKVPIM